MYGKRKSDIKSFIERDSTSSGRGIPRPPPHVVSTTSKTLQQSDSSVALDAPGREVDRQRRHFQQFQDVYHSRVRTNTPRRIDNSYLERHESRIVSSAEKYGAEQRKRAPKQRILEYTPSPEERRLLYSVVDPRKFFREEDDLSGSQSVELVSIKLTKQNRHALNSSRKKTNKLSPQSSESSQTEPQGHYKRADRLAIKMAATASSESSVDLNSPRRVMAPGKLTHHVSQVLKNRDRRNLEVSYDDNFTQRRDRPMRSSMFPIADDTKKRKYSVNYPDRRRTDIQIPYMVDTIQGPRARKTYSRDVDIRHIEEMIRPNLPTQSNPKLQSSKRSGSRTATRDPHVVYSSAVDKYFTINEEDNRGYFKKYTVGKLDASTSDSDQSQDKLFQRKEAKPYDSDASNRSEHRDAKAGSDQPRKNELRPEDIMDIIAHHGPKLSRRLLSRREAQVFENKEDTSKKKASHHSEKSNKDLCFSSTGVMRCSSPRRSEKRLILKKSLVIPTKIPVIRVSSITPKSSRLSQKSSLSGRSPSIEAEESKSFTHPTSKRKPTVGQEDVYPTALSLLSKISDSIYKECTKLQEKETPPSGSVAALEYIRRKLDIAKVEPRAEGAKSPTQSGNPLEGHIRKIANEGLSKMEKSRPSGEHAADLQPKKSPTVLTKDSGEVTSIRDRQHRRQKLKSLTIAKPPEKANNDENPKISKNKPTKTVVKPPEEANTDENLKISKNKPAKTVVKPPEEANTDENPKISKNKQTKTIVKPPEEANTDESPKISKNKPTSSENVAKTSTTPSEEPVLPTGRKKQIARPKVRMKKVPTPDAAAKIHSNKASKIPEPVVTDKTSILSAMLKLKRALSPGNISISSKGEDRLSSKSEVLQFKTSSPTSLVVKSISGIIKKASTNSQDSDIKRKVSIEVKTTPKSSRQTEKAANLTKKAFETAEGRIREKINAVNTAFKDGTHARSTELTKKKQETDIGSSALDRKRSRVSFLDPDDQEDTISIFTGNLEKNASSRSMNVKLSDSADHHDPSPENQSKPDKNLTTWLNLRNNAMDNNASRSATDLDKQLEKEMIKEISKKVNQKTTKKRIKMRSEPTFKSDDEDDTEIGHADGSEIQSEQFDDIQELKQVVGLFNNSKQILSAAQGKMSKLEKHLTMLLERQQLKIASKS